MGEDLITQLYTEGTWRNYRSEKLPNSTIFWNPEALSALGDGLLNRIKDAINFDPDSTTTYWDELWGRRSALINTPIQIGKQKYTGIKVKGILYRSDISKRVSKPVFEHALPEGPHPEGIRGIVTHELHFNEDGSSYLIEAPKRAKGPMLEREVIREAGPAAWLLVKKGLPVNYPVAGGIFNEAFENGNVGYVILAYRIKHRIVNLFHSEEDELSSSMIGSMVGGFYGAERLLESLSEREGMQREDYLKHTFRLYGWALSAFHANDFAHYNPHMENFSVLQNGIVSIHDTDSVIDTNKFTTKQRVAYFAWDLTYALSSIMEGLSTEGGRSARYLGLDPIRDFVEGYLPLPRLFPAHRNAYQSVREETISSAYKRSPFPSAEWMDEVFPYCWRLAAIRDIRDYRSRSLNPFIRFL